MKQAIIISGSLAQRPGQGGHTWVFLQYLLGFKRLGHEVIFVDWFSPEMCRDALGKPCSFADSENLRYFQEVMTRFGLEDSYSLLQAGSRDTIGIPRDKLLQRVRASAFLLNVMAFLKDDEILAAAPRRVFLDIDPGFGQMWQVLGLHNLFQGHDAYATIGLNIGSPGCTIPTCGIPWITTLQPVVLDLWPSTPVLSHAPFTSVASWRGIFGPIEFRGKTYGLRVHEFRKFITLPQRTQQRFDLALDIHHNETRDLALLAQYGWNLIDPAVAAGDPWKYQRFIQQSLAELTIAKNMYVDTHSGWFSDRSICYLAAGRPVIAQDTGLAAHLSACKGLLLFRDIDQAAAAIEEVAANPAVHGRAARELAREYFDSDKVLGLLADRIASRAQPAYAAAAEGVATS